jgi:hypothetical protein
MVDQIASGATHVIVGGLAANLLVIFSLLSVAMGGEGSCISRERRLPKDSDGKLFAILFAVGAVCGMAVSYFVGFSTDVLYLALTGGAAFVAGLLVAFPHVAKLNEAYLARAASNLEEGHIKEALEDAREVARSSERLRAQANQIIEMAREMRGQSLDGLSFG